MRCFIGCDQIDTMYTIGQILLPVPQKKHSRQESGIQTLESRALNDTSWNPNQPSLVDIQWTVFIEQHPLIMIGRRSFGNSTKGYSDNRRIFSLQQRGLEKYIKMYQNCWFHRAPSILCTLWSRMSAQLVCVILLFLRSKFWIRELRMHTVCFTLTETSNWWYDVWKLFSF